MFSHFNIKVLQSKLSQASAGKSATIAAGQGELLKTSKSLLHSVTMNK